MSRVYPPRPVVPLPPPANIAPLLRFCRWSALVLGIVYGMKRHSFLQNRADRNKELRDARKAQRKIEMAKQKKIQEQQELKDLERDLGNPLF